MAPPKHQVPSWGPLDEGVTVDISGTDHAFADAVASLRGGAVVYVGTGGDVVATLARSGNDVTFKNVPEGTTLPWLLSAVKKLGTTAGDMVAGW